MQGGGGASQLSKLFISHPLDGIPHHFIHPHRPFTPLKSILSKGQCCNSRVVKYVNFSRNMFSNNI